MKTAIIVMSDPATESEDAFGRVFNALAAAYDFDQADAEVQILFQGTGTRWPALLTQPDHPLSELYQAVSHTVAGASAGCAAAFGATEDITATGLDLLTENPVPGTAGLPSLRHLTETGHQLLVF